MTSDPLHLRLIVLTQRSAGFSLQNVKSSIRFILARAWEGEFLRAKASAPGLLFGSVVFIGGYSVSEP